MNFEVAKECTILSDEETITFPEVIQKLAEAGIESYIADLLTPNKTYFAENIAYTVPCLTKAPREVSAIFDTAGVITAIRAIQSGKIKYQEFVEKIMEAGVIYYFVTINGQKAIYFGRGGEMHIEDFFKK